MAGTASERTPAAGLVFFEGQEKPRQYVIFRNARIKGSSPSEVFTTTSLQLEYSFLDEEQAEIYTRDGKWFYRNLSAETFTFVGGHHCKKDQEIELQDGYVIRIINERMLTAVFLKNYVSARDWRFLNIDTQPHVVEIAGKDKDNKDVTLSAWSAQGRGFFGSYPQYDPDKADPATKMAALTPVTSKARATDSDASRMTKSYPSSFSSSKARRPAKLTSCTSAKSKRYDVFLLKAFFSEAKASPSREPWRCASPSAIWKVNGTFLLGNVSSMRRTNS